MPKTDLHDLRVLVTRPSHQAQAFINKLQSAGAQTTEFPCIDIHYKQSLSDQDIDRALNSDLLIFTSPNAVTGAIHCQLFNNPRFTNEETSAPVLAAIGQTTRNSLHNHQLRVSFAPAENTDSEGFIEQFNDAIKPGSNITIVRGRHGRNVLKQKLESLGANVSYLCVYDQVLPPVNETDARNILLAALPCVISITSDMSLENLLQLSPLDIHGQILASPLVVNSQRCAQLAKQKGFTGPIVVATPPGDYGQFQVLSTL